MFLVLEDGGPVPLVWGVRFYVFSLGGEALCFWSEKILPERGPGSERVCLRVLNFMRERFHNTSLGDY